MMPSKYSRYADQIATWRTDIPGCSYYVLQELLCRSGVSEDLGLVHWGHSFYLEPDAHSAFGLTLSGHKLPDYLVVSPAQDTILSEIEQVYGCRVVFSAAESIGGYLEEIKSTCSHTGIAYISLINSAVEGRPAYLTNDNFHVVLCDHVEPTRLHVIDQIGEAWVNLSRLCHAWEKMRAQGFPLLHASIALHQVEHADERYFTLALSAACVEYHTRGRQALLTFIERVKAFHNEGAGPYYVKMFWSFHMQRGFERLFFHRWAQQSKIIGDRFDVEVYCDKLSGLKDKWNAVLKMFELSCAVGQNRWRTEIEEGFQTIIALEDDFFFTLGKDLNPNPRTHDDTIEVDKMAAHASQ